MSANPLVLERRASILRCIRALLDAQGFVEVETPVRIPCPANEPHISAPPSGDNFLRTSPELHMKRLLCAGCERIYQMGPCFREGERGERHRPEFTMLEWYRANGGYLDVLADFEALVRACARLLHGEARWTFGGVAVDAESPWLRLTVQEAYRRLAGWDPLEKFDAERFDLDMALKVEPALPKDRPCVLIDYPAQAASLSRLSAADPRVAERWEAYIGGIELCNAFGELTDAKVQRERFIAAAAQRRLDGDRPYPLDEPFLEALERGMPPSGGAALGVDRLCMVLLDLPSIDLVRAF